MGEDHDYFCIPAAQTIEVGIPIEI